MGIFDAVTKALGIAPQLKRLEKYMSEITEKLDELGATADKILGESHSAKAAIAAMQASIDELQQQLDAMQAMTPEVVAKFEEVRQKLDAIDAVFEDAPTG